MRRAATAGSRCGPGKTWSEPTSVHVNGKPQALAWNIGTTGSTTSASPMPSELDWRRGERVEHDRAMRVDDALRLPRGAARVAHRRRRALVDVPVGERLGVGRREQLLVLDRAGRRLAGADRDHVLEADAVLERLDERPQRLVGDQDAIAGMRRDVGEVVGVEPQVERVRDEAADRSAEVGLQVLVVVPRERRDAVAVDEAELVAQRQRELLGASGEIGVRVGVPALVGQPARDRLVAEQLLAAPQDRPARSAGSPSISPCMSPSVAVEQMGSYLGAKLRARTPPRTGSRARACRAGGARAPT